MNLPLLASGLIIIAFIILFTLNRISRKSKKLQKIWDRVKSGDTRSSIRVLKALIIKEGGTIDLHFLLAECYRREGNCQEAIAEFRLCLDIHKKAHLAIEREIREGLLECFILLKRDDEALKELFELVKLDPMNTNYLFKIAKIFYLKGILEHAITYLDRTLKADPTHGESLFYLGMIMFHANQDKEAVGYLTKTVQHNPKNYRAYYYLGMLYKKGSEFAQAIICFQAAQVSPKYKIRVFFQKGNCFREMNEIKNAIIEYKKGIAGAAKKDSTLLLALKYALAGAYETNGKLVEAIAQWEEIYSTDESYRDVIQKLEKYHALRADDNIKDFIVSSASVFEGMCLDIVNELGYDILEVKHIKTSITNIIASPRQTVIRNFRRQRVFIKLYRDAVSLGLETLKNLAEEAKSRKCVKAICISPENFKPEAGEFTSGRQIELIGENKLTKLLTKIKGEP